MLEQNDNVLKFNKVPKLTRCGCVDEIEGYCKEYLKRLPNVDSEAIQAQAATMREFLLFIESRFPHDRPMLPDME